MLRDLLSLLLVLAALAGCPGGSNGVGDSCGGNDDCDSSLQCLNGRCVPHCDRAPDCGDGYRCSEGMCLVAHGQAGDTCKSEVDCAAGLSCQINGAEVNSEPRLVASCTAENSTRPAGAVCDVDNDCRNGTCDLGHCIDLCRDTIDCASGNSCVTIPRVAANGALFAGCLPTQGAVTWNIPVFGPSTEILLPVPTSAESAELVMRLDDPSQKVGAGRVLDPSGHTLFTQCLSSGTTACSLLESRDQFFANEIRHLAGFGQSVLHMPSRTQPGLQTGGTYRVQVASFWPDGSIGSAIPHVTAVVQFGEGSALDLHFFFLNLDDHPCAAMTGNATLDAASAQTASFFQDTFFDGLKAIFSSARLVFPAPTYTDIKDHPELDALDIADVGSLLRFGRYSDGINVFFVRSLSPIGIQAFGPNPGPASIGGTIQSGIVIALDTLCYRDWPSLARLTAHEIARYMGLYHNVEAGVAQHPTWRDPIDDSDGSSSNLMYFSEHAGTAGTDLSPGQRDVLRKSPVLR